MSLLLDALKKAEKAKDDARRREQLADGQNPDDTVLQVRTRNQLPDIARPLELHSEDVPGGLSVPRPDSPVPDAFSTAPTPPSKSNQAREFQENATNKVRSSPSGNESAVDSQSAQRASAKRVFEAKFREPNPKLPFYITMALLGSFAIGTIVYFWFQLRPPPPLVNANVKAPADERKVEVVASQSAAASPALQQSVTPAPVGAQIIPGLPNQRSTQAVIPGAPPLAAAKSAVALNPASSVSASARASAQPGPARQSSLEPRAPSRQGVSRPPPRTSADSSQLSINRAAPGVNPKIETAWSAYNRGDLSIARSNYQDMLREEPTNRDALLGMAAVEIRSNRLDQAEGYYRSLLQVNPRDAYAQTGLLSLQGQIGDASHAESRVKNLLANDPEAQVLNFTLGNQYAQQGRWPEAQQAYFKAYSGDPENPDFAYNLAVSLDHVRQPKLALEYYQRAISLAQHRSTSFDQALARKRAQELSK